MARHTPRPLNRSAQCGNAERTVCPSSKVKFDQGILAAETIQLGVTDSVTMMMRGREKVRGSTALCHVRWRTRNIIENLVGALFMRLRPRTSEVDIQRDLHRSLYLFKHEYCMFLNIPE